MKFKLRNNEDNGCEDKIHFYNVHTIIWSEKLFANVMGIVNEKCEMNFLNESVK